MNVLWKRVLPIVMVTCAAVVALVTDAPFINSPARFVAAETNANPNSAPIAHQTEAKAREVERRFKQAAAMLHARQYEYALTALHRVLELEPAMPEAHVNMGYTMLGLKRDAAARDFFTGAIELRPMQANAYYGLALALEAQDDRAGALGAMRSFVHLARPDDPFIRKARSALWEWQSAGAQGNAAEPSDPPREAIVSRAKIKNIK